jgi:hypothetical protein
MLDLSGFAMVAATEVDVDEVVGVDCASWSMW